MTAERDPQQKVHLFDKPKNVKLVIRGLLVACAVLFALDAVIHRHVVHPWERMFGFYPIYGFVSCVTLVLLAKELRKLVMRSENYYDPGAVTLPPDVVEDGNPPVKDAPDEESSVQEEPDA